MRESTIDNTLRCHFQFRAGIAWLKLCRWVSTLSVQRSRLTRSRTKWKALLTSIKFLILVKGTPNLSANQQTVKASALTSVSQALVVPDWPRSGKLSGMKIAGKSPKYAQFLQKQLLPDQSIYLKPSFEPKTETYQGMQTKENRDRKCHWDIARCVSQWQRTHRFSDKERKRIVSGDQSSCRPGPCYTGKERHNC